MIVLKMLLRRLMEGMIDIIVCSTSLEFDCFLELVPFLALLVPVFDPLGQLSCRWSIEE